jgi:signal peptidase I
VHLDDELTDGYHELDDDGDPFLATRAAQAGETPSPLRSLLEWVGIIAVALVVAFGIKAFLFPMFFIPSESMEDTLQIGDRIVVNKLSYKAHDLHRGDIVVFERPPGNQIDPTIKDLIKRVVGLSGDVVEGREGKVVVNGRVLEEPYVKKGAQTSNFGPITVPDQMVWVMGDNREHSADSRVFGPIRDSLIVGRAFLKIWPPSHIGGL